MTTNSPIKPVRNACPKRMAEKVKLYTAKNMSQPTALRDFPFAFFDSETNVLGAGEINMFRNVVSQSVRVSLNVMVGLGGARKSRKWKVESGLRDWYWCLDDLIFKIG